MRRNVFVQRLSRKWFQKKNLPGADTSQYSAILHRVISLQCTSLRFARPGCSAQSDTSHMEPPSASRDWRGAGQQMHRWFASVQKRRNLIAMTRSPGCCIISWRLCSVRDSVCWKDYRGRVTKGTSLWIGLSAYNKIYFVELGEKKKPRLTWSVTAAVLPTSFWKNPELYSKKSENSYRTILNIQRNRPKNPNTRKIGIKRDLQNPYCSDKIRNFGSTAAGYKYKVGKYWNGREVSFSAHTFYSSIGHKLYLYF